MLFFFSTDVEPPSDPEGVDPSSQRDLATPSDQDPLSQPDFFGVEKMTSVRELFEARVHLGHKAGAWNPLMKPYLFGTRAGIHIIDLDKTLRHLRLALNVTGKWIPASWLYSRPKRCTLPQYRCRIFTRSVVLGKIHFWFYRSIRPHCLQKWHHPLCQREVTVRTSGATDGERLWRVLRLPEMARRDAHKLLHAPGHLAATRLGDILERASQQDCDKGSGDVQHSLDRGSGQ